MYVHTHAHIYVYIYDWTLFIIILIHIGKSLASVTIVGGVSPQLSSQELIQNVSSQLVSWFGDTAKTWVRIHAYIRAYIQYLYAYIYIIVHFL